MTFVTRLFKRKKLNNHNLTRQQYRILGLMAQGQSNKEIAMKLSLSPQTVKNHVSAVLRAMDAQNRTDAAIKGIKLGIIRL